MKRGLLIVGVLLMLAGAVFGFLPHSVMGVGCGSVFQASSDAHVDDLVTSFSGETGDTAEKCDSRLGTYRPIVWLLLIVGAATAAGSLAVKEPADR